jgi:hypothetical protein
MLLSWAAQAANFAPTITNFSTQDNPALINSPVTFSLRAIDPDSTNLTYSVGFGDGTTSLSGSFVQGSTVTLTHTYTTSGSFSAFASVSDGSAGATVQPYVVMVPAPAAPGVTNTGSGKPVLVNPTNGVSMGVNASNGGVVQLAVSVSSLTGDTFDPVTTFNDFGGVTATVSGPHPVHQFTHHGIFVAVTAGVSRTNGMTGGIQCKMITIGAKETGEQLPNVRDSGSRSPGDPPSSSIDLKNMKGRFDFSGVKNDRVIFNGTFKLPPGLDTSLPHEIYVGIGNNITNTQVSSRGVGDVPGAPGLLQKLRLRLKVKKDAVTAGGEDARINIVFNRTNLVGTGFETEGVSKNSKDTEPGGPKVARKIQIAVVLDGVPYEALAPVNFGITNKGDFGAISGRSGL